MGRVACPVHPLSDRRTRPCRARAAVTRRRGIATRTLIKICGVCRPQDARAAVEAGADAVGVVLAPSRREVSIDEAVDILCEVPEGVARVGVFVDADPAYVAQAVRELDLDRVQFHGSESAVACSGAPAPVVRVFRVGAGFDPVAMESYRGAVEALLLDTLAPGEDGGSGATFDWDAAAGVPDFAPLWLAGGLTPDNVGRALRRLRPAGVDVSTGVEARVREKDPDKVRAFCEAVRASDEELAWETPTAGGAPSGPDEETR